MVQLFEELAELHGGQVGLMVRLHDLADGDPRRPEEIHDLVRRSGAAPLAEHGVDPVVLLHPAGRALEFRVRTPLRVPQGSPERPPLVVGGDGDRDPRVVATVFVWPRGLVEVLWRPARAAVAFAHQEGAVRGVLDHLLGGDVECGVHHGDFDKAALAALPAVLQREQEAEERVQARVGIPDGVRLEREQIGMSRQPRESRRVLDHEGEGRLVAPRAVQSEARHPHHDEVGPIAPE